MENTEKKETGYHLYGMHPVLEAVLSGRQIEKVLLKQGLEGQQFRQLLTELDSRGIPFQFVPAERLARFRGGRNQGVVAYLPQIDYMPLEEMVERAFQKDPAPVFVLLDGVSDVRNLGAVARSAECAGAGGIILPAKGGAAINADGVKASAGATVSRPRPAPCSASAWPSARICAYPCTTSRRGASRSWPPPRRPRDVSMMWI